MDNETIRIAIGLRLEAAICVSHSCAHYGENVDNSTNNELSCKWSEGRHPKHASINEIIHRALCTAQVHQNWNHRDFIEIMNADQMDAHLLLGRVVRFSVGFTFPDIYDPFYRTAADNGAGSIAKMAEIKKKVNTNKSMRPITLYPLQ